MKRTKAPEIPRAAYSVDEFAAAHCMSRRTLYELWKAGTGPRYLQVGGAGRRGRRIIPMEAAAEWRARTQ